MKRVLLGVISAVLVLASLLGLYTAGVGLEDIPGIERNKNLQAADIEDAIDLIEENLDAYNSYLDQKDEIAPPEDTQPEPEQSPEPTPTPTPTPAPTAQTSGTSAAAQSEYGKWQATYNNKQQAVAGKQAAYDEAASRISNDEAALAAARANLNAAQAKLNSIPSADNARNIYNEYLSAKSRYDAVPDDPDYQELKIVAKSKMDNEYAAYESALGGFASIDELSGAYTNASNAVAAAQEEVQRAEQQLAADQSAFDTAKSNLDYAKNEVSYSKSQMDNAQAALSSAQAADANDKKKAEDEKAAKEKAEKAAKEAEETAKKLAELENQSDAKDIVESGLQILLDNEDIYSRVVDESDAEEVIDASREYLEETQADVSRELTLRHKLYVALRILAYIGAAAGIVGIVVTIFPKKFLFIAAIIASSLTAAYALVLNAFGMLGGYMHFVYERANGGGSGSLQRTSMIMILFLAVISLIIVIVCQSSFKKALRMRKLRQQMARMNARARR